MSSTAPPTEPVSGLSGPRGRQVVGIVVTFVVLAAIAVGLRIYGVYLRGRRFFHHDYFVFAACLCAIGMAIVQVLGVTSGGVGLPVATLAPFQIVYALKTFIAAAYLWATGTWCAKMSVLLLYHEIFGATRIRVPNFVLMGVSTVFWIAMIITNSLLCRPFSRNWDREQPGTCGSDSAQQIATAIVNLVVDLAIFILPLHVIFSLQMSAKKKTGIIGILALGLIICGFNIVRMVTTTSADWEDFTYSLTFTSIFGGLEIYVGIICACVPTMRPVFFPKSWKQSGGGSQKLSYTTGSTKGAARTHVSRGDDELRLREDAYDRKTQLRLAEREYGMEELGYDSSSYVSQEGLHASSSSDEPDIIKVTTDIKIYEERRS